MLCDSWDHEQHVDGKGLPREAPQGPNLMRLLDGHGEAGNGGVIALATAAIEALLPPISQLGSDGSEVGGQVVQSRGSTGCIIRASREMDLVLVS
jgi:hypothetical protein